MAEGTAAPALYRLRDDVEIIRRQSAILLFGSSDERAVRASPAAIHLLPLLRDGADFERLHACLRSLQPAAADIRAKLGMFLDTLVRSGLVIDPAAGAPAVRIRRRHQWPLLDLDPLARTLAGALAPLQGRAGALVALLVALAAMAAIAAAAVGGALPALPAAIEHLHWAGVALFALLVVPLHELGHAVACRLAGIPVGHAGILLHGRLIPGPYVDTSQSYRLASRWRRFMIPAAGPLINLSAAGASAAALLHGGWSTEATAILQGLLTASLLFVYFDTNPFVASDGSHCIEALLDDELARRHAFRPARAQPGRPAGHAAGPAASVNWYRRAAVIHSVVAAALFWLWWG